MILVSDCVYGPERGGVAAIGQAGEGPGARAVGEWLAVDLAWSLAMSTAGFPLKVKVASSKVMVPVGPVAIAVSGGVVSTMKVLVAGVGSGVPPVHRPHSERVGAFDQGRCGVR